MAASHKLSARIAAPALEPVAPQVWLMRGGLTKTMNVYLLQDSEGITIFDAGIASMTGPIRRVCERMGGLRRVVLGHAHPDHRGSAAALEAPVVCHADEVLDAQGDGGKRYFDYSQLGHRFARAGLPLLLRLWDGGPVSIAETVSEGDEIAGFEVVELAGHSPGLIALWRAADRLCLASDVVYTLDPQTGRFGKAALPHRAFNWDTDRARESVEKLASLNPAEVWLGHANPVTDDVSSQLKRAAQTT